MAIRLEEFMIRYARGRGVTVAKKLASTIREIISVKAPVRRTNRGRLVATTRATPGAPPRFVSGDLYHSVKTYPTTHGMRVVIWRPYGVYLEKNMNHPFVSVALKRLGISGRNA